MNHDFENKIISIDETEATQIKEQLAGQQDVYVVEIEGDQIQSWYDYISVIQSKFKFPTLCYDNMDRYFSWMRDLGWIEREAYVLIINNFDSFLESDLELKKEIITDFSETILPFWQYEVEEVVVEGKAKPFMVYLVN